MSSALVHRGPDDSGELVRPGAAFVFRRLSIIDVAHGNQPITSETGRYAILLNGEIYNHRELRPRLQDRGHRFKTSSDAEVVLHLWEERGEACLSELRGMFAFAIWDFEAKTLFLVRDRIGKKPLYYYHFPDGGLTFGSEIKALLQDPGVPRVPDPESIDHFLTLQYVPSPRTAFQSIFRLPPAHLLKWHAGNVTLTKYWSLDFKTKVKLSEEDLRDEIVRLLRDAVRVRLESEVPLGAFLSGGLDSSSVVAFAAEALTSPLKTFSIGFSDSRFDESRFARLVATTFGTEHHELTIADDVADTLDDIVWHYDQPFGDSSAIPSFHVARITRPHVTVVLNGDGGDESFGGYGRYRRMSRANAYFRLPSQVRLGLLGAARPFGRYSKSVRKLVEFRPADGFEAYFGSLTHVPPSQKPMLYAPAFARELLAQGISPPLEELRRLRISGCGLTDAMLETDLHHYLPDDLLVKMDVATMAHSLEARSPFLDHQLIEFMASVPAAPKMPGGELKHLLKRAMSGILPQEIIDRPKMGFGVPLASWLRTSLRNRLEDAVLSDTSMARGYFRPDEVRRMVAAHMAGSGQYQYILWDMLMLELWHRTFIDRIPSPQEHTPTEMYNRQ